MRIKNFLKYTIDKCKKCDKPAIVTIVIDMSYNDLFKDMWAGKYGVFGFCEEHYEEFRRFFEANKS